MELSFRVMDSPEECFRDAAASIYAGHPSSPAGLGVIISAFPHGFNHKVNKNRVPLWNVAVFPPVRQIPARNHT